MGCAQTKQRSMISKKIPVSILKKKGEEKFNQTLTNTQEIEQIGKKIYDCENSQFDNYNISQNPILRRRRASMSQN
ncbi:unnamed protein product [Paramecium octaurelia]|uniref:Uncharacterized protein n=1 Tax=Paramecium octaurelia TaxID=43137 RepID=A0A8S1SHR5_PAROT|nr:unnamed protein product [Paramecium octaurelia]